MSSRSTQAHRLALRLTEATGVRVEIVHQTGAVWSVQWGGGPTREQMQERVTGALAGRLYPAMRDRRLRYRRGWGPRDWAARAVAAHRDGSLAGEVTAGVANRDRTATPSWATLTPEEHAVLAYVERLIEQTPYPDRASDPADEPLIEQLLDASERSEYTMARILLNADRPENATRAGDPTRAEWNARLAQRRAAREDAGG